MNYSKRRRRRSRHLIFYLLLFIAIICGVWYVANHFSDHPHLPAENASEPIGSLNESQPIDSSNSDGDWRLVLVNRRNPMVDSEKISLTELSNGEKVDTRIYPYLQKMFDDMRKDGVYPVVASGYRTKAAQQQIYNDKLAESLAKGLSEEAAKAETERWVAVPGTSEHQSGLGIDINADGVHSYGSEVYDWLEKNAHRYGFIRRYPEDKIDVTGIANEPWHYRYVGQKAAAEIYQKSICLEEYLENR